MLEFLLFVTPGSGMVFFLLRWVKGKTLVSGLRLDAAQADAHLTAARQVTEVAQGTAREQRVLLADALQVAKAVEHVDETLTGLAEFLTARVEWQPGDDRALPGAGGQRAVTAGDQAKGDWS